MKLKVCGMRDSQNLAGLLEQQPDYVGFIFFPKSKRYVGDAPDPALFAQVKAPVRKVGVFVNAPVGEMEEKASRYHLDCLQLHGEESPADCAALKEAGHCVIKAFSVGEDFDFDTLSPYEGKVDYFLFDTKGKEYGGNGVTFDWTVLRGYPSNTPFFLSGGIGPEHVEALAGLNELPVHALDVNSRFELEPALKNLDMLADFKDKLNKTLIA